MKKIVISLIAAAAIWIGSTAFIGSQIKENLQSQIIKNNQLNKNGMRYKINNYQKNFFTSRVEIEIDFTNPEILALIQDSIKLPLVVTYNIEHGPIFFKNGIGFGAARTHKETSFSSLLTEEAKKEFLSFVKDDIIIKSNIDVSFTKNASYNISSTEVETDKEGKSFHMAPLNIKGHHNLETYNGSAQVHIDSLKLQELNSSNGLNIQDLDMDIDIEDIIEDTIMLGDIKFSIKNLTLEDNKNPKLQKINLATNMHMVTKKDSTETLSTNLTGSMNFKDTKFPIELPDLKNINAKMDMHNIGIKGMVEFQKASEAMQKEQSKVIVKMQSNPSEEEMQKIFEEFGSLQEKMINKIVHSLNNMLIKDKTVIEYAFGVETKDNRTTDASVKVGYKGDIEFNGSLEEIAKQVEQQILNLIDLDVKVALDTEHIRSLPDTEALQMQLQMGIAQGFIKEEKGRYILNSYYRNQELIVNDNNLTATVLPFLIMATQGGGL